MPVGRLKATVSLPLTAPDNIQDNKADGTAPLQELWLMYCSHGDL